MLTLDTDAEGTAKMREKMCSTLLLSTYVVTCNQTHTRWAECECCTSIGSNRFGLRVYDNSSISCAIHMITLPLGITSAQCNTDTTLPVHLLSAVHVTTSLFHHLLAHFLCPPTHSIENMNKQTYPERCMLVQVVLVDEMCLFCLRPSLVCSTRRHSGTVVATRAVSLGQHTVCTSRHFLLCASISESCRPHAPRRMEEASVPLFGRVR